MSALPTATTNSPAQNTLTQQDKNTSNDTVHNEENRRTPNVQVTKTPSVSPAELPGQNPPAASQPTSLPSSSPSVLSGVGNSRVPLLNELDLTAYLSSLQTGARMMPGVSAARVTQAAVQQALSAGAVPTSLSGSLRAMNAAKLLSQVSDNAFGASMNSVHAGEWEKQHLQAVNEFSGISAPHSVCLQRSTCVRTGAMSRRFILAHGTNLISWNWCTERSLLREFIVFVFLFSL